MRAMKKNDSWDRCDKLVLDSGVRCCMWIGHGGDCERPTGTNDLRNCYAKVQLAHNHDEWSWCWRTPGHDGRHCTPSPRSSAGESVFVWSDDDIEESPMKEALELTEKQLDRLIADAHVLDQRVTKTYAREYAKRLYKNLTDAGWELNPPTVCKVVDSGVSFDVKSLDDATVYGIFFVAANPHAEQDANNFANLTNERNA